MFFLWNTAVCVEKYCGAGSPYPNKIMRRKHTMKKFVALLLALTMVFALVACGTPAETPNTPAAGESALKVGAIYWV